jgi:hypothetical protein
MTWIIYILEEGELKRGKMPIEMAKVVRPFEAYPSAPKK